MYDFIILTAAVTRPELHQQIFPRNLQFVDGLSIKWLINVDDINNTYSVEETIEQFKSIFAGSKNIDIEFLYAQEKGCFFSAARRLAIRTHELLGQCKTGIIWLEDDWEINSKTDLRQFLSNRRLKRTRKSLEKELLPCPGRLSQKQKVLEAKHAEKDADWFVSLVPRTKVSFNPGIWSKSMFVRGFHRILQAELNGQIDDPETLCADPFNEEQEYKKITLYTDPIFQDAGRRWSAGAGLEKWDKNQSDLREQGSVTYNQRLTPTLLSRDQGKQLEGFFLLPDLLVKSPLKLMVKADYQNGDMKVKLLGIPWLSFELRMTEHWKAEVYLNRIHAWAYTYPFKKTTAKISWYFDQTSDLPERIEVSSPMGDFSSLYHKSLPLCALLVVPIQALAGVAAYSVSLVRIISKLETR